MFDVTQGFKIKTLKVDNFKTLRNFEISFTDDEGKPLPVIVLAGVNGSGKTTLLEIIAYAQEIPKNSGIQLTFLDGVDERDVTLPERETIISDDHIYLPRRQKTSLEEEFQNRIAFFPALDQHQNNSLQELERAFLRYIDKLIYEEDILASKAYTHLAKTITDIFEGLDLGIKFDSIDNSTFAPNFRRYYLKNSLKQGVVIKYPISLDSRFLEF